MAALSPDDLNSRFQAALGEHNFGRRCHALAALGRSLAAAPHDGREALLDGLQAPGLPAAFVEKARLVVAKTAGCLGYSRRFLDHPSQSVRFSAVRGGLLRPSDAREAFLSEDCGRKLKKLLVKCPALPCDQEVLEQAERLFGAQDKELLWQVLMRAQDEELFRTWMAKPDILDWVEDKYKESKVPGIPQLAKRFPEAVLSLVSNDNIVFKWYWVMPLLQTCPEEILRRTFLGGHTEGSGPLRNKLHYDDALASWGWRHQSKCMLDICRELASTSPDPADDSNTRDWGLVRLVRAMTEVTSTKKYITTTQKIATLVLAFSRVPEKKKSQKLALSFVRLLPDGLDEHRTTEIRKLSDAFWQIVAEVGRASRRDILVGPEGKPALTDLFSSFLTKLPPPLAVEQFFRVLSEFEAGSATYRFVQSNVCKSDSGRHDELMGRVFERFLQKEGASAKEVAEMFQVLLEDAQTMDVVQRSFDLLTQRLGGHAELRLLQRVVQRMCHLEAASRCEGASCPKSTLAVPTAWVRFVRLPCTAAPHIDHLHRLLHAGTGQGEPLGAMLEQYGPSFFWDALAHVLQGTAGTAPKVAQPSLQPPDLEALKRLDLAGIARPLARGGLGAEPSAVGPRGAGSVYFASLSEVKNKTYGRDDDAREAGYKEMMRLAQKDADPSAAFEDFLPFLVGRLNKEKEGVRCQVVNALFMDKLLPVSFWEEKLQHLRALHKVCAKTRSPLGDTWRSVGRVFVSRALDQWAEGAEASEACIFGLEVGKTGKEEVDLPGIFVTVSKTRAKAMQPAVCESAARWVFETSVRLSGPEPYQTFWASLGKMAEIAQGSGAERALWERWPFVAEHWRALLTQGVEQKAADFVLVGVVDHMVKKQGEFVVEGGEETDGWWVPLESSEYQAAVAALLRRMELGEIPARDASAILVRRVRAVLLRGLRDGGRLETRAAAWLRNQSWDVQKHRAFLRMPCRPTRHDDSTAAAELATLSKVLQSGGSRRQVLWQITEAAAMLRGPLIHSLLRDAIQFLDPRHEGMARCVARSYPYLNTSLTKGEEQQGCPDVLTPLLEFWLADDATRDGAVEEIMQRSDFHYFLFFGTSFAKHLCKVRQEWLQKCFERLQPAGEAGSPTEFYHYSRRGPSLVRIAQAGVKRYRIPCPRLRGGGERRSRRAKLQAMRKQCETKASTSEPMQLFLWHPDTQAQFLTKALTSTKPLALAVIPRMEFADGIARVNELLASYPKDSSRPQGEEDWGWEVLQTAGAYSSLEAEIERHFGELKPAWVQDAVGDPEVQQLLVSLGRTDDASTALSVLGRYAGKVKQAKEAVVKMVGTLSPAQSRRVMVDVMLAPAAGVALQIAALRLTSDLNIPRPLELYKTAWNDGACHRDVAANIMSKLATTPAEHWSPDDVQGFFAFFDLAERAEDHGYVADLLLDQLTSSPRWSLPFLPKLVERLAMMPGSTLKAIAALKATTGHVTEVVGALTRVLATVRMAARAEAAVHPKAASNSQEAQVLTDLASVPQNFTMITGMPLDECDPAVLRRFVLDQLRAGEEPKGGVSLTSVLNIWARLLRKGDIAAWPGILEEMEARLSASGKDQDLGTLADTVVGRVRDLHLPRAERGAAVAAVRALFERLLDVRLAVPKEEGTEQDEQCKKKRKARVTVAHNIVLKHWAHLLSQGCAPEESDRLFSRCPEGKRTDLATVVITRVAEAHAVHAARSAEKVPMEDVAKRALTWLASPQEARDQHLATLVGLWAKVVACEAEGDFSASLQLLGSPLPPNESVAAFDELLKNDPSKPVLREALAWLGRISPEAAVSRWSSLLTKGDTAEAEDVKSLLKICEAEGLPPPALPPVVARTLPDEVLQMFVRSDVPEARVVALQVLQAKNSGPGEMGVIDSLCSDACQVVRVAAQNLKASLSCEGGHPSVVRQGSSNTLGKGKGKRKGKGKGKGKSKEGASSDDDGSEDSGSED